MYKLPSGKLIRDEVALTAIMLLSFKHDGINKNISNKNKIIFNDDYYVEYIKEEDSQQ